jgi:hydroxyethylthiazole kinase-like uncharacterized protein yjeF
VKSNVILTAAEMRAAEARVIAAGTPVETLMERAGVAAAEAIWRFAGPMPTLVLCGPGNNGGDGYVIARELSRRGVEVQVAALGEPTSRAARSACQAWNGPVEPLDRAQPAGLMVDALFGTGLARPLAEDAVGALARLAEAASVRIAIDLPSGVSSDDGRILSPVPCFDLTISFAALKPAHLLQPAAGHMGRLVVADIGVQAVSRLQRVARPRLAPPRSDDHKYSRGYVVILGGEMPGAAALAATGAARAGAGYVRLVASATTAGLPACVVQGSGNAQAALADDRIGAVVVGPGLGKGDAALVLLHAALASDHPLVLDADALTLLAERGLSRLNAVRHVPILTPHAGEFARLFGTPPTNKVEAARVAAAKAGAVLVFKGADTVIADPDGRAAIAAGGSSWLSTAGTGDVLAGIIAARRAAGRSAFEAACEGVWLHGEAARKAGPALIADDLLARIGPAMADCL